jgi:hypothetical protein
MMMSPQGKAGPRFSDHRRPAQVKTQPLVTPTKCLKSEIGQFPALADLLAVWPDRSDSELARDLIMTIAGHCWDGKSDMLGRVFASIIRHNPKTLITPRRVRAFWHREPAVIRFREIIELAHAAG